MSVPRNERVQALGVLFAHVDHHIPDRDRNVATFIMMYGYTSDVIYGEDDGTGGAYGAELPLKYFLNYYQTAGN